MITAPIISAKLEFIEYLFFFLFQVKQLLTENTSIVPNSSKLFLINRSQKKLKTKLECKRSEYKVDNDAT